MCLHTKYPLFLSRLKKLEFYRLIFEKYWYLISWKSVQLDPNCSMRTGGPSDGRTDMTKLIVTFSSFANAPKNRVNSKGVSGQNVFPVSIFRCRQTVHRLGWDKIEMRRKWARMGRHSSRSDGILSKLAVARCCDSLLHHPQQISQRLHTPSASALTLCLTHCTPLYNPYPTAFPYGNGMVLHF